jgi:hypothetical protein
LTLAVYIGQIRQTGIGALRWIDVAKVANVNIPRPHGRAKPVRFNETYGALVVRLYENSKRPDSPSRSR